MELDRKLNLVIPITRDGALAAQVVSAPIGITAFKAYHAVIAQTFTRIYASGLNWVGGAKVAAMVLEEAAKEMPRGAGNWWDGPDGVENGLMNEIRRMTNVIVPSDTGWKPMPFADALKRDVFSEDEIVEVEGAIVFFTANWHMHATKAREGIIRSAAKLWGWELSSLPLTELAGSLPTSMPAAPTGVRVTA